MVLSLALSVFRANLIRGVRRWYCGGACQGGTWSVTVCGIARVLVLWWVVAPHRENCLIIHKIQKG